MSLFKYSLRFSIRLILLYFVAINCYATMYKWVDEEGNTHYSEKPPVGDVEVQTVKPPPKVDTDSALKELEAKENKLKEIDNDRAKQAETAAAENKPMEINKRNCETSRRNLASVNANPRVYSTDADGNRYKIGEDERQAKIAAAKEAIAKYCK